MLSPAAAFPFTHWLPRRCAGDASRELPEKAGASCVENAKSLGILSEAAMVNGRERGAADETARRLSHKMEEAEEVERVHIQEEWQGWRGL